MNCPFCNYTWSPRKKTPVSCPRCKRRLDCLPKKLASDQLSKAKSIEKGFQRTIYVMSIITPTLETKGITPVIIGGSAVEFYTRDWYATADIDLAINKDKRITVDEVLRGFGFLKTGRMWVREDLNLYIESPGDINDISIERLMKVKTDVGFAYVIGLEDIIFDRLEAAKHWKSEADKQQALRIATLYFNDIDWEYIKNKCKIGDSLDILSEIIKEAKIAQNDS